ncbi:MAG: hypothetical protein NVS9B13_04140 [Candidatus Acidiferrum sp.]
MPEGLPPQMESTIDKASWECSKCCRRVEKLRNRYLQFDYAANRECPGDKALCYIAKLEHSQRLVS